MRSIEQYNDFVRRKCELAGERGVPPPKTPNRRPKFARARLVGVDRVVGEALTDVPLIGFVQRLTPVPIEEAAKANDQVDQETQASIELPLDFSKNAITEMDNTGLVEADVRKYINAGVIRHKLDVRDLREVSRERDLALLAKKQAESALALQMQLANDGEIDLTALQSLHVPHAH